MKVLLYISLIISILTYNLWGYLPKESFYIGNSVFIFLICTYIFFKERKSNIKFVLFSLSLNNLFDELFFDNTKLELNELLTVCAIIVILIIRIKHGRKHK